MPTELSKTINDINISLIKKNGTIMDDYANIIKCCERKTGDNVKGYERRRVYYSRMVRYGITKREGPYQI